MRPRVGASGDYSATVILNGKDIRKEGTSAPNVASSRDRPRRRDASALVELLRSLDVGHGNDVDLEVHGDFGAGLIHVIYLSPGHASVDQIAAEVGYAEGVSLRTLLRRRLGRGVREIRRSL
jgi:hypothetical protein